jgi:hypothetical protein
MASAGDIFRSAFNDDKILGGLWNAIAGPSDAEKAAKAAQDAAIKNAQDQLDLEKTVRTQNNAAVDQAMQQIFGGPAPTGPSDSSPHRELGGGTFADNGSPLHYGDNNYYGGGTQSGDLSVGGVADNPANGLVVPGQVSSNPFQNSNLSGMASNGGNGGGTPGLVGGFDTAEKGQLAAEKQLEDALNGIQDPNLAKYVGDVQSQANVSDRARDATSSALQQLSALTNPQETAQEKLIRENARRNMENQMKSDRDAMAQSLKQRGAYGSGAELARQLDTQQEAASRRALEEMGANAGASQRAMQALGQFSDLGVALGNQDLQGGHMRDLVNQANQQMQEQHNIADTRLQSENNRQKAARAATVTNQENVAAQGVRDDTQQKINDVLTGVGIKTGVNSSGAQAVGHAAGDVSSTGLNGAAWGVQNDPAAKGLVNLF